jgi:NADH:ubiquinone oxidoreductase subunit K
MRFAPLSHRRMGTVFATAVAFALTAALLVWLAINSLVGRYAGTPRRQALAIGSIILATAGLAVSVAVVIASLRRRRKLQGHMRPGEKIVGLFPCELVDLGEDGRALRARQIRLTLTNQRVLIHEPEQNPDPKISLELEEIAEAVDHGPTPSPGLRRCVLQELVLSDGTVMSIRMDAGTGIDFIGPRGQYLEDHKREMRALIVDATGPTPSRPNQSMESILVDGEPTVCLLELGENYLRVVNEYSPPLADLYYYFHWDHMTLGGIEMAAIEGLPEDWVRLRLQFHDTSTIVISGSKKAVDRVRRKAVSGGAVTTASDREALT